MSLNVRVLDSGLITQHEIGEEENPDDEATDCFWSHLLSGRYPGRHGDRRTSRRARAPGHHRGASSTGRVSPAPLPPTKDTGPSAFCATRATKACPEEAINLTC